MRIEGDLPERVEEFLRHSNYIDNERSDEAFEDAKEAWCYAFLNINDDRKGNSNSN